MWVGLIDSSGQANITSVTITTSQSGESGYFLIGLAQLKDGPHSTPTPEPASLAMMGSGFLALLWKLRKRNRG